MKTKEGGGVLAATAATAAATVVPMTSYAVSAPSSSASATASIATVTPSAVVSATQQEQVHGTQDISPGSFLMRRRLPFSLSLKRQKVRKYICICIFFSVFSLFLILTIFIASLQYTERLKFAFPGQSMTKKGYNNAWWEKLLSSNSTSVGGISPTSDKKYCNNTKQGRDWITDSRGVMCPRKDVLETGCCDMGEGSTKYFCGGCMDTGGSDCCELYEGCVSCCMTPEKLDDLNKYIVSVVGQNKAVGTVREENSFFVCSALCRTSSKSIVRQRFYKSVTHKYCYN